MTASVNQTTRTLSTPDDFTAFTVTSSASHVQATETAIILSITEILAYLKAQNMNA